MGLDAVVLMFAYGAGAASFFSPCAVGLLPAYIGYFLGTEERPGIGASGIAGGTLRGAGLGLVASFGFFSLFLLVGLAVAMLGTGFLGPYLVWVSRGVGVALLAMGAVMLTGRTFTIAPRVKLAPTKSLSSVFAFGTGYGLASLGCTLPVFLSVVLAAFTTSSALAGVGALAAYGAGMATFMVIVSTLLGASKEAAQEFLRRVVPHIKVASAIVMIAAGAYILYYYSVVIA